MREARGSRGFGGRVVWRGVAAVGVLGAGLLAAMLLAESAGATTVVAGDTASISGTYTSHAATTSTDPSFDPCAALPPPHETFWAFVNGNEHISADLGGSCSASSAPDAAQPGVTDYALTYGYAANWGIVINSSDPLGTLTLTMSFHTIDNIVATATYQVVAPPTTTATSTGTTAATATSATTTATAATTTQSSPATTAAATTPGTSTMTTATTTVAAATTGTTTGVTTIAAPLPKPAVITTAATIHGQRVGKTVTVTITTNNKRRAVLCYASAAAGKPACKAGYGSWRVRLAAGNRSSIKRIFVVKVASLVVARKTITIRVT